MFEPKKMLQKWLECGLKKNIFTVKMPLIAPTLGGGGGGGGGPPLIYILGGLPPSRFLLLWVLFKLTS